MLGVSGHEAQTCDGGRDNCIERADPRIKSGAETSDSTNVNEPFLEQMGVSCPSVLSAKQALVLAMLRRKQGATIATVMKATGWHYRSRHAGERDRRCLQRPLSSSQ
jgi:hypothetical protein